MARPCVPLATWEGRYPQIPDGAFQAVHKPSSQSRSLRRPAAQVAFTSHVPLCWEPQIQILGRQRLRGINTLYSWCHRAHTLLPPVARVTPTAQLPCCLKCFGDMEQPTAVPADESDGRSDPRWKLDIPKSAAPTPHSPDYKAASGSVGGCGTSPSQLEKLRRLLGGQRPWQRISQTFSAIIWTQCIRTSHRSLRP